MSVVMQPPTYQVFPRSMPPFAGPNHGADVLVRVSGVSKKFCRHLKKSLWYGLQDVVSELNPFRRSAEGEGRENSKSRPSGEPASDDRNVSTSDLPQTSAVQVALREGEFWANKDISFEVRRGECLGLIGHNGAGKTTLLKMLNGLIKPDTGRIEMRGRVGALIALGAGFNPILSGRENIYVNGAVLGLSKREIDEKIEEIIDFADIRDFIDSSVQSYSSGMQVRLGFAVATALDPDVLILDEVLAVGDASFHAKCFQRIGEMVKHSAVIFVSHDESSVARITQRALLLDRGRIRHIGDTNGALAEYNQMLEKNQAVTASAQLHKCIREHSTQVIGLNGNGELRSGGSLVFVLKLLASSAMPLSKCLLSIYHNGATQVAQVDFSGQIALVREGLNTFKIEVPRLDLAAGRYTINLGIFGTGISETVIHLINFARVAVVGPPFLGSAYKIPALVTVND